MFPAVRFKVSGLDNDTRYLMLVDIIPCDKYRYKYLNQNWVPIGQAESHIEVP
jgi:hypothetical protein